MTAVPDEGVIESLCLQQLSPWLGAPIDRAGAEAVYHALNATVRSVFLLRISEGRVSLLEKPGFKLRDTFNDSSQPEPEGLVIFREEYIRAQMYRQFFERCLADSDRPLNLLIAIDVNDAPIEQADAPVFAFQKPRGGNTVLVPDVDFLHGNFYIPPDTHDPTAYAEKAPRAIFAGSTTGGRTITAEVVRNLDLPRLRAGVFFKGRDQVDFRLPRIVQCENREVVEMVAALGVNNAHCSWAEQFQSRLILSLDGNGATCSRVAIGLLSQAALVKYDSPHLLYYFGALVPWRHFIPVAEDADVIAIVEAERRHPLLFESVAREGRVFARRYLNRAAVCGYTAAVMRLYQSLLADGPKLREPAGRAAPETQAALRPLLELGAHISGIGDVWGWPGEWVGESGSGRAIEAMAVIPAGLPDGVLGCRVWYKDGSFSTPQDGAYFYGTRGQDKPVHGFELRLHGDWVGRLECAYRGRFTDGHTAGPLGPGELCRSPTGAPLEAFDISLREKV